MGVAIGTVPLGTKAVHFSEVATPLPNEFPVIRLKLPNCGLLWPQSHPRLGLAERACIRPLAAIVRRSSLPRAGLVPCPRADCGEDACNSSIEMHENQRMQNFSTLSGL